MVKREEEKNSLDKNSLNVFFLMVWEQ